MCTQLKLFFCICRPLLKQIKNSAESHIVLDCSTQRIYDVLKQAQQIGMMSDYHSYLITSLVSSMLFLIKSFAGLLFLAIFINGFVFIHIFFVNGFFYGYSKEPQGI